MTETNSRENRDQIPKEDDTQGQTGKVISDQNAIEGLRKEVAVESYSLVANIGQVLKDLEFPADKRKIIDHVKSGSSNSNEKEAIISALEKLEEKSYNNVSDITMSAGLVY
jgi:ribonuclease HI